MPNISSNRTPLNRNQPSTDRLRPAAGAASSSSVKDPLWVGGLRAKGSRNVFTLLTKACFCVVLFRVFHNGVLVQGGADMAWL